MEWNGVEWSGVEWDDPQLPISLETLLISDYNSEQGLMDMDMGVEGELEVEGKR